MKLALVRRRFASAGGAELYLTRLLDGLAAKGHELHLFAENWERLPDGTTLHQVKAQGSRAERPLRFAQAVEQALGQETFDCVFSLERTLKQDVYRAGDGLHRRWIEQRKAHAPRWKRLLVGRGAFHRAMTALEAQTFSPANTGRIIVNSDMVKREILHHFPAYPQERIHLVRNGIDLARFQNLDQTEARKTFGLPENAYHLLFVGSGAERKGLPPLLEAVRNMQDEVHLLVAGKDRPPPAAPRNVTFAGPLAEIEQAYAAADLFVFPPIYEPSSNVVFEALAAGLPVIASKHDGASEILETDRNGSILNNPRDPDEIRAAILQWKNRETKVTPPPAHLLSIERNLAETLEVLELAAREARENRP